MKKNQINKTIESNLFLATFSFTLIELARNWYKKEDMNSKLASALIYVNLTEFFADSLKFSIRLEINANLLKKDIKFSSYKIRRNTSIENSISILNNFEFPSKEKILKLLKNIKENRNLIFHSLLLLRKKGKEFNLLVDNIYNDSEEFIRICINLENNFSKRANFLNIVSLITKGSH